MYTLVTACMNREHHLRQALPAWLKLPQLGELIIVDWSNANDLTPLASSDERIKVVRVINEPRWILSYAYNVGINRAAFPQVLKCDSDCIPKSSLIEHQPRENCFFAGYWKSGHLAGKPSVNGQCYFLKSHFTNINGYSEYIRSYGRDDEDFYDRLIASGIERREIHPDHFSFIEHANEERMRHQVEKKRPSNIEEVLKGDVSYNEIRNLFLARQLPWSKNCRSAPFQIIAQGKQFEILERDRTAELSIPLQTMEAADLHALRYLVCKIIKLPDSAVMRLDRASCLGLISNRWQKHKDQADFGIHMLF